MCVCACVCGLFALRYADMGRHDEALALREDVLETHKVGQHEG